MAALRTRYGHYIFVLLFLLLSSSFFFLSFPRLISAVADVWPFPGPVHYIHFGGCCPLTEFCQVQSSLCVQVLRYPTLAALLRAALEQ